MSPEFFVLFGTAGFLIFAFVAAIIFLSIGYKFLMWILQQTNGGSYIKSLKLENHQRINPQGKYVSSHLGLSGEIPLTLKKENEYIPVWRKRQGKPDAKSWDQAQLIAICMLVEEYYGGRVPYGIMLFNGTNQYKVVQLDKKNRDWVFSKLSEMRNILSDTYLPSRLTHKCGQCSLQSDCWRTFPNAGVMQKSQGRR